MTSALACNDFNNESMWFREFYRRSRYPVSRYSVRKLLTDGIVSLSDITIDSPDILEQSFQVKSETVQTQLYALDSGNWWVRNKQRVTIEDPAMLESLFGTSEPQSFIYQPPGYENAYFDTQNKNWLGCAGRVTGNASEIS